MAYTPHLIPVESLCLLVFDLDGTLIDSRRDLANSGARLLKRKLLMAEFSQIRQIGSVRVTRARAYVDTYPSSY